MNWIDEEGDENEKRENAEQCRGKLIATSNYWERLVRRVEADVKAINGNEYWKTKLVGVPLEFCNDDDGYQISKSGLPGVIVNFSNDGEHIHVYRYFFGGNPVSKKTQFPERETLEISTHGKSVILQSPVVSQFFVIPEQASRYILRAVIESLKITETDT